MSDQRVLALKSLEIHDVKVYQARNDKLTVLTKGYLEILYLPEFNRFMLRVNNFKYILSTHLSILASLSEEGSFRSYVLPNVGGHYILKLKTDPSAIVLRNLETIFACYSQFSYQQNHEHDLENQAHRRGDYSLTFGDEPILKESKVGNQSETVAKASKYIKLGGDILKQNIMKAANYVGKNLSQTKEISHSQGPNQLYIKTIEELRNADENCSLELPRYEVLALLKLVKEVEKIASSHAEQDIGVKLHPATDKLSAFKKSAVESAHSLWKGMDEALGTLSKNVKAKKLYKAAMPKDKMDIAFNKIDQNIKSDAPLPISHISPNQQQPDITDCHSKVSDQSKAVRSSEGLGTGSIFKNLGAIKQKIIGVRGEAKSRTKENHA